MVSKAILSTIVSPPPVALAAQLINFIKQPNITAPQLTMVVCSSTLPLGLIPMALVHVIIVSILSFVCLVLLDI
jgi:hypothetical protein